MRSQSVVSHWPSLFSAARLSPSFHFCFFFTNTFSTQMSRVHKKDTHQKKAIWHFQSGQHMIQLLARCHNKAAHCLIKRQSSRVLQVGGWMILIQLLSHDAPCEVSRTWHSKKLGCVFIQTLTFWLDHTQKQNKTKNNSLPEWPTSSQGGDLGWLFHWTN